MWLARLLLLSVVTVSSAWADTGLIFPSNTEVADSNSESVRFRWTNPHSNGLPIYGTSGAGVTYIWKILPRQQTGYYTTMFWANDDGAGDLTTFLWSGGSADTFYGMHPYPPGGSSGTTHDWEIAVEQNDFVNGTVVKGQWYTQVAQASGANGASKVHAFYWDWPNTDAGHKVTRTSPTNYGNTNPPSPALTFGDAPWQPGRETCACTIRGLQIYNALLSEADIASELASPLSTVAGAASIWYLNLNPTPNDITDKSGKGHHPSWVNATKKATLYDTGVPATSTEIPATVGTWYSIPNTTLQSVCPTNAARPDLFGPNQTKDCNTITAHYVFSSGWDETNQRMMIGGGGHGSYYGDEPYGIYIEESRIERLKPLMSSGDASAAPTACQGISASNPGGRHWNSNVAYLDHAQQLLLVGGAGACDAGSTAEDLYTFSPATQTWTRRFTSLRTSFGYDGSSNGGAAGTVYDKARQRAWFHDCWQIYEYVYETQSVTAHSMTNGCPYNLGSWFTGVFIYDPVRSRYVGIDNSYSGSGALVYVVVGASGAYTWVSQATTGSTSCIGTRGPGFTYDIVQDRYVCWAGGNTIYLLNPTTNIWTTQTVSGTAPTFATISGTNYGQGTRLQYSRKCNCLIFYGDWTQTAKALRLTAGEDVPSRCAKVGVLVCRRWDTAAEFTPAVWPAKGLYPASDAVIRGSRDTTVKASGLSSLKFTVPGGIGANMAGNWWEAIGNEIQAGETVYFQWRQRFDTGMVLHPSWTGQGWKQVTVHNFTLGSCASLEATIQNASFHNFGLLYTDCGGNNVQYGIGGGDVINQYSNVYPPGSDGTIYCRYLLFDSPANKCFFYRANEWMTFKLRITIGTFGAANSTLQAWAGYEGGAQQMYVNRTGYTINTDGGVGFDVINLTPYNSLDAGNAHVTAYTWYDDLIISTQDMGDPPLTGPPAVPVGDTTPPSSPTGVTVSRLERTP